MFEKIKEMMSHLPLTISSPGLGRYAINPYLFVAEPYNFEASVNSNEFPENTQQDLKTPDKSPKI